MNTHADKIKGNKSQSLSAATSQKKSGGESTFQFVDNRPVAITQRKLMEGADNSPQAKQLAQLQTIADSYSGQQVIQLVRYVKRSNYKIEEVDDAYELQWGERFLTNLEKAEFVHHQADLARFKRLKEAKEKGPIMDMKQTSDGSSATESHLNTPYVDKQMRPRKRLQHGVTKRFLTPTEPAVDDGGLFSPQLETFCLDQSKSFTHAPAASPTRPKRVSRICFARVN